MKTNAKWITSPRDVGQAAVSFCHTFAPRQTVKKATLHVSSMGIYALWMNGKRIGKGILTPGWTSYRKRVQYQSYDVTAELTASTLIEIGLAPGWAVGDIGYRHNSQYFAQTTSAIAWMDVVYENGTQETLVTDETWEAQTNAVTYSEIYHGETVDLTAPIEKLGKAVAAEVKSRLIPQVGEWITEQERLAPVEIIRTPNGELVIDFGQNLTGYAEVSVQGPRGSRIVIHHAEVLDSNGNFYTANYRKAKNENVYILSGGKDVFKPTYTFQGFRYIRLTEYPFDTVDPNAFRAIAVNSNLRRTGHYTCGNEKINQLYHNIIWGQKSNYLDIPTDCPQRDERLGWTGDAQVFCRTATINFDVERFFEKWLGDVALEQTKEGAVYGVVPDCLHGQTRISAAWGDAACVIPWQLYLAYGSRRLLKKHFPMMKKWVQYLHNAGPEEFLWLGGTHYGDWLAMDAGEDSYVGATSNDLIASAFFAYSTGLVIRAGEVLEENVDEYRALYAKVRAKFREYFMENGMPKSEFPLTEMTNSTPVDSVRRGVTQTAITLILHFGLCEESERAALAAKLVELIRENGMRMSTGFVGTPYLLHVLSDHGYTDMAYTLLMQEKNPSWLYSVCHGATTMWEHWNSIKDDGSFWSTSMNSFNHYAYGAVFDWIFGVSSGITPLAHAPAYREVNIAPHPHKCLGYANASIDSRHGTIRSSWYYKGDTVYYEIEIPSGVTAHLTLPSGYSADLSAGIYHFAE